MQNNIPVILLGADRADEAEMLSNILIGQGYHVEILNSATAPAEVFDRSSPDLMMLALNDKSVISDETLHKLKIEADASETPVLIVRDLALPIEPFIGPDSVFDSVLRPYDRETVLARTKTLLRIQKMSQELKLVREQLQSAQKYECVGALAAGVAHEFNNMMCSIMGFAELALDVKNTDNETLKESAEVSYETAKRASATAACLLAFSRQVKSSKAIGDVNDAIRGALRLLQRDLEKNGIKVDLSFGALPKSLYAQGPLQQVFVNLIINAWHAMMEVSGDRALSIKSWAEGNSRIYVSVSDTGPGIHPSKHEKIFEPFYTTKTSGKPNEGKGSGLGLVIVKEVVRDHNGTVRVESDEGKGACFTVTLPVDTGEIALNEERDSSATPADHPTGSRPYSILVVDDEEPSRRIINRLLQRQGHEVFTASNMAEALVLLWSQKLDLIVLDLVMPGSNGPDNVRQLRDQEIDLPILICTGNTDTTLIQRALDAGANGVVMKPFSIEEFSTHMYSCLAAGKKVSG